MQIKPLAPGLLALALTACAATSNKPVDVAQQDKTGTYDGNWVASVAEPASTQSLGGKWRQSCTGDSYDWNFTVNDGRASITAYDEVYSTPVASDGRFVFLIPTDYSIGAASGTVATLGDGTITRILRGNLDEGKRSGHHVWGVAQFGNDGCTAGVTFTLR